MKAPPPATVSFSAGRHCRCSGSADPIIRSLPGEKNSKRHARRSAKPTTTHRTGVVGEPFHRCIPAAMPAGRHLQVQVRQVLDRSKAHDARPSGTLNLSTPACIFFAPNLRHCLPVSSCDFVRKCLACSHSALAKQLFPKALFPSPAAPMPCRHRDLPLQPCSPRVKNRTRLARPCGSL